MRRTPEPQQLMNDPEQVRAYADADFGEANRLFLELFQRLHPKDFTGKAVDLGCGPADIPIAFARRYPEARLDATDGAPNMLALAMENLTAAGLEGRIHLHCDELPSLDLAENAYDAVLSNSLLHHLQHPDDLWLSILHCGRPGSAVLVMDLRRPRSAFEVDILVNRYALDESDQLREDFHNSLHAAYTAEEVQEQLRANRLDHLQVAEVSDRHLAVYGFLR